MNSGYYREQAREMLKGNWGKAVAVCLLGSLLGADVVRVGTVNRRVNYVERNLEDMYRKMDISVFRMLLIVVIAAASVILIYSIIIYIIGGAVELGMITFFIRLYRREPVSVSDLFSQFHSFGKALGLRITTTVLVSLWTLLLVIPGIIAVFRYAMAPYILAEDPDTGIMEALSRSSEMMRGNKLRLFFLSLSFFGWMLLGTITFGIALLWVNPYVEASWAAFYLDISAGEERPFFL